MFDPDALIIRAHVHIVDIEPPIARVLELPKSLNLAELHEVLQAAFGWTDSHLHEFIIGGLRYGAPETDDEPGASGRTFEATEVRLADLTFRHGEPIRVVYEYDFGDGWRHELTLTEMEREEGAAYPRCVAGTRAGPPDDSGGPWGYADFVEAWRNPAHDEHKEVRRWVGRKFDPERFDLEATNKAIARAMKRARGGYRFRREG
jgi:hypothetical protein